MVLRVLYACSDIGLCFCKVEVGRVGGMGEREKERESRRER